MAFRILMTGVICFWLAGCGTGGGAVGSGDSRRLEMAFARTGTGSYPDFTVTVAAYADDQPVSGLSLDILPSLGTASFVTDNNDGTYTCTVDSVVSGECLVTATVDAWDRTIARTALVLKGVADGWGQPMAVAGDYVNTVGWEDSISISPDGKWLFVFYAPTPLSAVLIADSDHPWARYASGPFGPPERPDFYRGRIGDDGYISYDFPLYNVFDLPNAYPPVVGMYGFRRQADGTFAEPFHLRMDDGDNGCITPFGAALLQADPAHPELIFAFDDPSTLGGEDTGCDIYTVLITPGENVTLGRFSLNVSMTAIDVADFLPVRLGIDPAGHQGNPNVYADSGGTVRSLWVDDETQAGPDRDLYVSELTGTWPDGPWTPAAVVPDPVSLPGVEEIQPFFNGEEVIFTRIPVIVACAYNGGPLTDSASWAPGVELLTPDDTYAVGRIIVAGEPTTCIFEGTKYLYFVYAVIHDYDVGAGAFLLDLNAGCMAAR